VTTPPSRPPLWILAALLPAHNAEEALTIGHYLPIVRERVPEALRGAVAAVTYPQLLAALALATVVPLAIVGWAHARPASGAARWLALLLAAVLLLNVASHVVVAALVVRGYAPGLATALALNLPGCAYLLRRAWGERWLPRSALVALAPAAVIVHGPLLLGLIALGGALAHRG